jgi:hypothetical protein
MLSAGVNLKKARSMRQDPHALTEVIVYAIRNFEGPAPGNRRRPAHADPAGGRFCGKKAWCDDGLLRCFL